MHENQIKDTTVYLSFMKYDLKKYNDDIIHMNNCFPVVDDIMDKIWQTYTLRVCEYRFYYILSKHHAQGVGSVFSCGNISSI